MDLKIPESKKKKTNVWIKMLVLILVLAVFGTVSGFYAALKMGQITLLEVFLTLMPQSDIKGSDILVLGIDDTKGMKRSDTIIVAHIEPRTKRIGVISIPRDSRVNVPGVGMTKINHAYAYGKEDLTKRTVENFLDISIEHVVKVYVKGVEDIIDKIGGVKVNVDKRMYYIDRRGGLYVDLQPGMQVLNGKQAVGYLRFRHDAEGDIARIRRQQDFLTIISSQVMSSGKLWDIPKIINELASNIETDLSSKEIVSLALHVTKSLKEKKINSATIPGGSVMIGGISYWQPNAAQTKNLVQKVLYGLTSLDDSYSFNDASNKTSYSPINRKYKTAKKKEKKVDYPVTKQAGVEVLNGNGIRGAARSVANKMKKKGIRIIKIGNASHHRYENTILIDWKGNIKEAKSFARLINLKSARIISYNKPQKRMDLTLVLGKDWDNSRDKVY